VDDERFDRLTRVFDKPTSRRATLTRLAGAALAALGSPGVEAEAKPKKCKKPNTKCGTKGCCEAGSQVCLNSRCVAACQFTTNTKTKTLTLKANCTLTKPITIPNGFTLDGNRKTITLDESLDRFPNGVITNADGARKGAIRRLTIKAAPLGQRDCAPNTVIVLSAKEAEIDDVRLQNLQCFRALFAGGLAGQTVRITHTTVKNWAAGFADSPLLLLGPLDITIATCTFSGIPQDRNAITTFLGEVTATISESTFTNVGTGVNVTADGAVNVTNNQMQDVHTGVQAASGRVDVTNNAIAGPSSGGDTGFSVKYSTGVSGNVAGNVISNFRDAGTGEDACAIFVGTDAGDVTIGANSCAFRN
jgi:hypothetical protein